MKIAILIHGAYGNPNENWFPWLKEKLEELNYIVYTPSFPTPENQTLESWLNVFNDYQKYLGEETLLIGHSIGATFILSILESIEHPVKGSYFVSGFLGFLDNPEFDNLNKSFVAKEFNWKKIKNNSGKVHIFHSDNDPYVPIEKTQELARKFNVEAEIISGAGHFNKKAGYTHFEELLKDVKNLRS